MAMPQFKIRSFPTPAAAEAYATTSDDVNGVIGVVFDGSLWWLYFF